MNVDNGRIETMRHTAREVVKLILLVHNKATADTLKDVGARVARDPNITGKALDTVLGHLTTTSKDRLHTVDSLARDPEIEAFVTAMLASFGISTTIGRA